MGENAPNPIDTNESLRFSLSSLKMSPPNYKGAWKALAIYVKNSNDENLRKVVGQIEELYDCNDFSKLFMFTNPPSETKLIKEE